MKQGIRSVFGYTGAALTLLVALLAPFVLMGGIAHAVAHVGLRIKPLYTGGQAVRTVGRAGYTMTVYAPVRPRWLERGQPFVQVVFAPVQALPAQVSEAIDLDGDNRPDVQVRFAVPRDEKAPLHGVVEALNGKYRSVADIGNRNVTELLARTGDRILLRVPLAAER